MWIIGVIISFLIIFIIFHIIKYIQHKNIQKEQEEIAADIKRIQTYIKASWRE